MGRVTRGAIALACALAALPLLGGCAKVEAMTYRPSLAAATEATVTPAPKLPASLTRVAAKKKAPMPKPVYQRPAASMTAVVRRPYERNLPAMRVWNGREWIVFDPDGPP